jgi:hypothetical protein
MRKMGGAEGFKDILNEFDSNIALSEDMSSSMRRAGTPRRVLALSIFSKSLSCASWQNSTAIPLTRCRTTPAQLKRRCSRPKARSTAFEENRGICFEDGSLSLRQGAPTDSIADQ